MIMNFFNRPPKKEEPPVSPSLAQKDVEVVVEEETSPLDALSLEEKFAKIEEVKKQIEELKKQRQDYFDHARQLEDKIRLQGVTEERMQKVREEILEGDKEIRETIETLRKDYDLDPKPEEVYAARIDMLTHELNRIQNNIAPEYRQIKDSMVSYFGSSKEPNRAKLQDHSTLNNFREYVIMKNSGIPEVADFYEKIKSLSLYEDNGKDVFAKEFEVFKDNIENAIKEKTLYKTEGELNEIYKKIDRLARLIDENIVQLREAEKKTGRFGDQSKYF